jgi:hypothetical protein
MIATPVSGYKSHISIDRRFGFIRARIAHLFAHQKNDFGLFTRTIGLASAEAKLMLANLSCNCARLIFHERRNAMG